VIEEEESWKREAGNEDGEVGTGRGCGKGRGGGEKGMRVRVG